MAMKWGLWKLATWSCHARPVEMVPKALEVGIWEVWAARLLQWLTSCETPVTEIGDDKSAWQR